MSQARTARCFLRARRHGVLATISQSLPGYPFGSVLPYMLDHAARPVVLVSGLAEHTRNIEADRRVSLLVHDCAGDVQSAPRITLIGDALRAAENPEALQARYVGYFPAARQLLDLGDFSFYRIEPVRVRCIGGFGAIGWVSAAHYAPPVTRIHAQESSLVAQLNADHARRLTEFCSRFTRQVIAAAAVVGVDCDGFDLRADGDLLRFDFAEPAMDADELRALLAAMIRAPGTA